MTPQGKVALVTGAARRVGREIALELARAGCDLVIHYHHSQDDAASLCHQLDTLGQRNIMLKADLADGDSWKRIVDETTKVYGRLDVLVNNASIFLTSSPDTIESFDAPMWEQMLRVNLLSAAAISHYASPWLQASGTGKIINLCDISAQRPWPQHLSYCVSKGALETLTLGLAKALAPDVQVNGIAPGIAEFPESYPLEMRSRLVDMVPLRRAGTSHEVASLVRYLVEHGDYITGQIIAIDGGRSLG